MLHGWGHVLTVKGTGSESLTASNHTGGFGACPRLHPRYYAGCTQDKEPDIGYWKGRIPTIKGKEVGMKASKGRNVPRPFELHWGKGQDREERRPVGPHHEPAIQLLEFEDGTLSLRFCYFRPPEPVPAQSPDDERGRSCRT